MHLAFTAVWFKWIDWI